VFDDEFNSADTISPYGSGNYNWYTASGFTSQDYTVSNGCVTILTDASGYSDDLYTPTSFQHGYFEARLQFYPAGHLSGAWPAFWSFATQAAAGGPPFAELDFVEAYPGGGGGSTNGNNGVTFLTTVHQWTPTATSETGTNVQNSDITPIPAGFNYDGFHTYGMLWTDNNVAWYIDNQLVMSAATGPGTDFTALEQDTMTMILGTGKNWPMTVDYVHVWH
jgi:beta-glucanase (GH16 family)